MRRKTDHVCIYYNDQTKNYDVKYNYTEYDAVKQRNVYKSKWKYNLGSMEAAKKALSSLRKEGTSHDARSITLAELLSAYERAAIARGLAPGTINSTRRYMSTISRFIPSDTMLTDIDTGMYMDMLISMRRAGFKLSTIKIYSGCLKKLFRIAYMHGFIKENIFDKIDDRNQHIVRNGPDQLSRRLITASEFKKLKNTLAEKAQNSKAKALTSETYLLLFSLLYYGGLRIGEALALGPGDFKIITLGGPPLIKGKDPSSGEQNALQVSVTKTLVSSGGRTVIEAGTKNHKDRYVPLPSVFELSYMDYLDHMKNAGKPIKRSERIFPLSYGAVYEMLIRSCEDAGIPRHTPHDFRHTYISNLIAAGLPLSDTAYFSGDTEAVILSTYVHATENYKVRLLEALSKFPK